MGIGCGGETPPPAADRAVIADRGSERASSTAMEPMVEAQSEAQTDSGAAKSVQHVAKKGPLLKVSR